MKDMIRRLNAEYGFNLSEDEIELVAGQAEGLNRLFKPLYEIDVNGVMPIMKVDVKVKEWKKES